MSRVTVRVPAAALVLVALAVPAAHAAPITPKGSVVIRWQSNPDTCAASGLCNRSGTFAWRPDPKSASINLFSRSDGFVYAATADAVARSHRAVGERVETCIDRPDVEGEMTIVPHGRGAVLVTMAEAPDFGFGACAGPLPGDVQPALPVSKPISTAALRKGTIIDLRGTRSFSAGPFTGEVVSTLTLKPPPRVPVPGSSSDTVTAVPKGPRVRYAELTAAYAVTGFHGDAAYSFSGSAADACAPFDTCGMTGDLALHPDISQGSLTIRSVRRTAPGYKETVAAGLRALRRGGTHVYGDAQLGDPDKIPGTVSLPITETVTPGGGDTCSGSAALDDPYIAIRRSRTGLSLTLQNAGNPTPDPLRTRCPGPGSDDIGDGALAVGSLSLSAVGRRDLELTLTPLPAFRALPFTGAGHGALTLSLRLIAVHARTQVERVDREPA